MIVSYPDNQNIIEVLSLVAEKAKNTGLDVMHGPGRPDFFREWNYRLLLEDMHTYSYDDAFYMLYDKMNGQDREFIKKFHIILMNKGYCYAPGNWNEGPGILYYDREPVRDRRGPYLYGLQSWKGKLILMLRIRNAEKCLDYVGESSDSIKDMFRKSDKGCGNKPCKHGVGYVFEGESRWKCGCCNAPFITSPAVDDIGHYINLVDLAGKR